MAEGLSHNTVYDVKESKDGQIWIGTRKGLNQFIPEKDGMGKFYHYGVQQGLSHDYIRAIQEDSEGRIWVTTLYGINVLVKKESSKVLSTDQQQYQVLPYTDLDGLKEIFFFV